MVLDGALADAEVRGDVLAGLTSEHQLHDLAFSRRELREVTAHDLPPGRQLADQFVAFVQQGCFAGESLAQPILCRLVFVACGATALLVSEPAVPWRTGRVCACRQALGAHVVSLLPPGETASDAG